jgi:hypothetical protein
MDTPFLRKMCFAYLYNLHTLNGKEQTEEAEESDEEPEPVKNFLNQQYLFSDVNKSKKKDFKLYNDFGHRPVINRQTWYKKPDVAPESPDSLKRQITQVEDKATLCGPVEKKAKLSLNNEEEGSEIEVEQKKELVEVADAMLAGGIRTNIQNINRSNLSQNANRITPTSIPNTINQLGIDEESGDDSFIADRNMNVITERGSTESGGSSEEEDKSSRDDGS